MPLTITRSTDYIYLPTSVCDACWKPITVASDAVVSFSGLPDSDTEFVCEAVLHKGKCVSRLVARRPDAAERFVWLELDDYLVRVARAAGLSLSGDAEATESAVDADGDQP
jgi:hypothetical protein